MSAKQMQPLYGVSIDKAVAAGDAAAMKSLLADAEALLADEAAVRAALPEITKKLGKRAIVSPRADVAAQPFYGIGDLVRKGSVDELAELHARALAYLSACDEIRAALPGLHKALGKR